MRVRAALAKRHQGMLKIATKFGVALGAVQRITEAGKRGEVADRAGPQRRDRQWARDATLGNPAHVKLIEAVRPTKRGGERPRQFTAGLGRTYRAARLRCQRRTTRSILVSMGRSLDIDFLESRPNGL